LHQIDIHKGAQKTPAYERINPYRKIPALIDSQGPGDKPAIMFESVAICFYLAEKVGRFQGSTTDLGLPRFRGQVRPWDQGI
jgi:GST-like protein